MNILDVDRRFALVKRYALGIIQEEERLDEIEVAVELARGNSKLTSEQIAEIKKEVMAQLQEVNSNINEYKKKIFLACGGGLFPAYEYGKELFDMIKGLDPEIQSVIASANKEIADKVKDAVVFTPAEIE